MSATAPSERAVLLTGVTGFLGSSLAHAMLAAGRRVVGLVRGRAGGPAPRERALRALAQVGPLGLEQLERLQVLEADVTEDLAAPAARLAGRVDEVWHCAVTFQHEERHREQIVAHNVDGTRRVLELALTVGRAGPPRFFHVSTAYVCGRREGRVEERLDAAGEFNNLYEWSKHQAELEVARYGAERGLPAIVFRPSILVGRSTDGAGVSDAGYYQVLRSLFLMRRNLEVNFGSRFDGELGLRLLVDRRCRVNLVPVDFAVEAMLRYAAAAPRGPAVVHVVNEEPPGIELLHEALCADLRLRGLTLVEQAEVDREPLDTAERMFHRRIGFQAPYVRQPALDFSTGELRRLVPPSVLPPARVDRACLARINRRCVERLEAEFGRPPGGGGGG